MLSLLAPSAALILPARSRSLRMSIDPATLIQPAALFSAGLIVGGLSSRLSIGGRPLECIWVRPGASRIGGVGLICVQDTPAGACVCTCNPRNSKTVPLKSLDRLPPEVRRAIHECVACIDRTVGHLAGSGDTPAVRRATRTADRANCRLSP